MEKSLARFRINALSEITVGSVLLAFPVAITEEVWNLGKELSLFSTLAIVSVSLFVLTWFVVHAFYQSNLQQLRREILIRVTAVYA